MTEPDASTTATWAALLAGWTEFASSAVALPDDAEGSRWKDSVAPAIALHATSMALPDLIKLDPEERPLAMDRSEMIIREQSAALNANWRGEPMPQTLSELIDEARLAWERALHEGLEWSATSPRFVASQLAVLAESLLDAGFVGEVCVVNPGTTAFAGSIIATARERDGGPVDDEIAGIVSDHLGRCDGAFGEPVVALPIRQMYREMDFLKGGPVRDVRTPVVGVLPAGQPLLIPVVSGGAPGAIPPVTRTGAELDPLPVVDADPEPG
ncbi:MAG: hypothetical protein AAGA55_08135 [Planctomycetota bacterium]